MRQNLRRTGMYMVALALLLCMYAPLVNAADFGSIGGSPAFPQPGNERSQSIFIFTLKPTETGENGVRIDNNKKEDRTVIVGVVDSIASNDGSFACRQETEKKQGVSTWVKLAETKVVVPAGGNTAVGFKVTVPEDASPGEHDACVTLQDTENFAATKGAGIQLGFRIAIRLAVQVPGKIVKNLSIGQIEHARKPDGTYTVTPVARNTGNVSLDVKGRVQLFSIFGQKTELSEASYSVLQGANMKWAFSFKPIFWGGFYKAKVSLAYNANVEDGLGVDSNGGRSKRVSGETKYFFVMPTTKALVAELAIPLVALAGLIIWLRGRYKRRTAHKRMEQYTVQPGDSITLLAERFGAKWKRLARANSLKAPYLLTAGQTLLVPKRTTAKPKKARHRAQEQGWVVDTPAPEQTQDRPDASASQSDWVSPRQSLSTERPTRPAMPARYPVPPTPTLYTQRESEPQETEDFPDWREGASEDELRHLGVLQDSSVIPSLQKSWNIDDENEATSTEKKTASRTKPSPKKSKSKKRS